MEAQPPIYLEIWCVRAVSLQINRERRKEIQQIMLGHLAIHLVKKKSHLTP